MVNSKNVPLQQMDYHTEFGAVGQMVQANVPDVSK